MYKNLLSWWFDPSNNILSVKITQPWPKRFCFVSVNFAGECGPSMLEVDDDDSNMMQSILRDFGDKIALKESDKVPKSTKKKVRQRERVNVNGKVRVEISTEWQGPAPWDPTVGGDGFPKFLCDVMVSKFFREKILRNWLFPSNLYSYVLVLRPTQLFLCK